MPEDMQEGLANLVKKFERAVVKFPKAVGAGLYQEALLVEAEAKKRCPVAPGGHTAGELRATITAEKPVITAGETSCRVTAGGSGTEPYSIAVHEHPSENSPPSWLAAEAAGNPVQWNADGTGPKFLEGPVLEARPGLSERLATRIDLDKIIRGA